MPAINIIDMRWHIEILICILNIAIFSDISQSRIVYSFISISFFVSCIICKFVINNYF